MCLRHTIQGPAVVPAVSPPWWTSLRLHTTAAPRLLQLPALACSWPSSAPCPSPTSGPTSMPSTSTAIWAPLPPPPLLPPGRRPMPPPPPTGRQRSPPSPPRCQLEFAVTPAHPPPSSVMGWPSPARVDTGGAPLTACTGRLPLLLPRGTVRQLPLPIFSLYCPLGGRGSCRFRLAATGGTCHGRRRWHGAQAGRREGSV